jgi:hypothetical protein
LHRAEKERRQTVVFLPPVGASVSAGGLFEPSAYDWVQAETHALVYRNPPPPLFSYCPGNVRLHIGENPKASPQSGLTFSICDSEILRYRNIKLFALCLILRFIRKMIRADTKGSKLCADNPRHTQVSRLSAACLRSTWQEEGRALPVASPPMCRIGHAKTLLVSAPSGLCVAVAPRSRAVLP